MAIAGAVEPALAQFTQGVREGFAEEEARVGPSRINICHLLNTSDPRDVVYSPG